MPDVGWLTGILLSIPDEGPSRGGEDKKMKYILKYRSPGGHSEHAHPKRTKKKQLYTEPKRAQLEHIEDWDR